MLQIDPAEALPDTKAILATLEQCQFDLDQLRLGEVGVHLSHAIELLRAETFPLDSGSADAG